MDVNPQERRTVKWIFIWWVYLNYLCENRNNSALSCRFPYMDFHENLLSGCPRLTRNELEI